MKIRNFFKIPYFVDFLLIKKIDPPQYNENVTLYNFFLIPKFIHLRKNHAVYENKFVWQGSNQEPKIISIFYKN